MSHADTTAGHPKRAVLSAISRAIPPLADFSYNRKSTHVSAAVLRGLFRSFEAMLVLTLGFAVAAIYIDEPAVLASRGYWICHAVTAAVMVALLEGLSLYRMSALASPLSHVPRALAVLALAFTLLFAGMFFLKVGDEFSRVWLAGWFLASAIAIVAGRLAMGLTLSSLAHHGRLYRRAAIYGSGPVASAVIADLEADPTTDIRICGVFDDRDARAPKMIHGYPRLGGLRDLVDFARSTRIDIAILALPLAAEARLRDVSRVLSVLPADVKLPAGATSLRFAPATYSRLGTVAMIDVYDKPIADWGTLCKWLFDKTIAGLAVILLAPVMIAIAVAIKLDSRGPVLFRQKRYGFNNELVEVFKFRSMYVEACDGSAGKLVTLGDPRVTRVGQFIRTTSLDELPQLFNVLIGNLSLVGPRPHATQAKAAGRFYDDVVEGYFARHKVKPGITGWAQVNGWRGETDTDEKISQRVAHDLYYIENWSVFLDVYILVMTPWALLSQRDHAY